MDLFDDSKCSNIKKNENDEESNNNNLTQKIEGHLSRYQFFEISSYEGNFFQKCVIFLKNIPKYIFNKRIIKNAEYDYNVYYHCDDLDSFINYFKRYNSIQFALGLIFRKSSLSKREIECLFNHEKCVDWINEFFNSQNNVLNTSKKLVRTK